MIINRPLAKDTTVKNFSDKSQVEEFQGETLKTPIDYSFDYVEYDTIQEVRDANKWPNDSEILTIVNRSVKAKAKTKAMLAATAAHREAYQASDDYKIKQFVKAATAMGYSEEKAMALAKQSLK